MFGQENMVVFVIFLHLLTNSGSKIEAGQIGQVYEYFWPPTVQYPVTSHGSPPRSGQPQFGCLNWSINEEILQKLPCFLDQTCL